MIINMDNINENWKKKLLITNYKITIVRNVVKLLFNYR